MVPLVVRSHFSLGWGVGDPERLARAARERGYSRLALTDTDGLYGLWEFLAACEREGLRPIIGAEITEEQRTEGRDQRSESRGQKSEIRGQRAEGRGQRAEDRGQRAEVPIRNPELTANRQSPIANRQSAIANRQSPIGNRQSPIGNRQSPAPPPSRLNPASSPRCVCLVENDAGYRNLCRLLTLRHCSGSSAHGLGAELRQAGAFDLVHQVVAHAEGLTVLVFQAELLEQFHALGVRACAAVPRRPTTGFEAFRKTARRLNAPLVAVPGSFFVDPEDHEFHRALRAISMNSTLSRLGSGDAAPAEAWLADAAEYRRRFEIEPEMIAATHAIAERCVFTGPSRTAIFPQWRDPSGQPAAKVLRDLAYAGAAERYGYDLPENIVERIEHELSLIERKGFSDYFLVVREIVRRSPRTCGRGSGAASIVAYCLGITNVCPVKFNLYFERFLNPGRSDPPDIDVDFAWDERDGVLAAVLGQYAGHCAMVSNHVFFQPRMLLREMAKVFGVPDGEIKRVLDRLPFFLGEDQGDADLDEQLERLPPLSAEHFPSPWPEILRLAGGLTGTPRNLSVHPGGVVITPRPITEYVPLEPSAKGVAVVQWEKDGSETGGLVKIDLLGNRSLAVIRDALAAIKADGHALAPTRERAETSGSESGKRGNSALQHHGPLSPRSPFDRLTALSNVEGLRSRRPSPASGGGQTTGAAASGGGQTPIDELVWQPEDDPATQATVAAGRTMGCFYIESPAMRLLQQKTQRGDYEHLVIHSSIIRPAANEYIREYIRRLRGGAWEPLNPLLTDVLAETYGIMVYQEHVALASMALAGFSHEEADRLRKIISKKDRERHLPDYKQRFADGARARGVSDDVIEQVWRMMMSFAGYSFCKPHSASYARVSFQAAWLKTHYPAEFMAAVISNQGGFYSTFAYVSEARRLGLTLRPLDVNLSDVAWTGHTAFSIGDCRLPTGDCGLPIEQERRLPIGDCRLAIEQERRSSTGDCGMPIEKGRQVIENRQSAIGNRKSPRGTLRVGLMAVKHLSEATAQRIVERREERPYSDMHDFLTRVEADEEEVRSLINCGACDALRPGADRATLLWEAAAWKHHRRRKKTEDAAPSLFDEPASPALSASALPVLPKGTEIERLRLEFAMLGFLCDRHPMALYEDTLRKQRPIKARDLGSHVGRRVTCAGWLVTGKVVSTREGEPMEFLTFEDETGTIETTFFPGAYRRHWDQLQAHAPCVLHGLVEEDFGAITVTVDRLERLGLAGG